MGLKQFITLGGKVTENIKEAIERLEIIKQDFIHPFRGRNNSEKDLSAIDKAIQVLKAYDQADEELGKKKDVNFNRCSICGADDMLHQADTDKCPKNGMEAPISKKQEWADTIFTPTGLENQSFNKMHSIATAVVAKKNTRIKELKEQIYRIKPNTEPDGYGNFCEAETWKEAYEDEKDYDKRMRELMNKACEKIKSHPDWKYGKNAYPSPYERAIVAGCQKAIRELENKLQSLNEALGEAIDVGIEAEQKLRTLESKLTVENIERIMLERPDTIHSLWSTKKVANTLIKELTGEDK